MQETYYIKGYEITIALGDEMPEESVIAILEKAVSFYETGMFESLEDAINLSYVLFLNESDIENKVTQKIEAKVAPALQFNPTDLGNQIQATILKRLEARSQGQMEAQASYLKELNNNLKQSLAEVTKKTGEVVSRETIIEEIINNIPTPKTMSPEDIAEIVREEVKKWKPAKQQKGGGASTFKQLNDVPSTYNGFGGKALLVKATEDGVEFGDAATPLTDTDDLAEGATNLYNRLPTGGATDQKLVKSSNTNYDAEWVDDAPGIQTDTRDNILAIATPTAGETWYATDIKRFYLYTGAGWVSSGTPFFNDEVNTTNPDTAPIESRVSGFTEEGIYNKVLSYCGAKGLILSKDRVDTDGAMGRSEEGRPVIFFDGEHQEFLIGVRIQRDGTEGGLPELRVIKGGNVEWVDLHNGDSDSLDLNGLPLVHGWMEDMGVEAHHTIIDPN